MAYRTANGATTDNAAEYAGVTPTDETELKLDAVLRDAERLVAYYAAPPDPVTTEYTLAAKDGEWRVFEYLVTTEGFLTGAGIGSINESFVDFAKVEALVKRTVGLFAEESGSNVAYVDRW